MKLFDSIKSEIKLSNEQSSLVNQMIGSLRFTRNRLIDLVDDFFFQTNTFIGKGQKSVLSNHLPYLKEKYDFIKITPSLTIQNMADNLENDYIDFIDYMRNPTGIKIGKPKKKYNSDKFSMTVPVNTKDITYNHIAKKMTFTKFKLGKEQQWFDINIPRMPFGCKPEELQSFIRSITFIKDKYVKNTYQVAICFSRKPIQEVLDKEPKQELITVQSFIKSKYSIDNVIDYSEVKVNKLLDPKNIDWEDFKSTAYGELSATAFGVDMGVRTFAQTSYNETYLKPGFWNKEDKRLVRAQRSVNRKYEGFKNPKNINKPKPLDFSKIQLSEEEKQIKAAEDQRKLAEKKARKEKSDADKAAAKAAGIVYKKPKAEKKSKSKKTTFGDPKNRAPKSKKGSKQRDDVKNTIDRLHQDFESNKTKEHTPRVIHKNYEKAKAEVAKIHKKISNQNRDYIKKLVNTLVVKRKEKIICIEDLNISGLMKNHNLAKAIGRASWGYFFEELQNSANNHGKLVIKCDIFDPSSKNCSKCGAHNEQLKLGEKVWVCRGCGAKHDRDYNASVNIKRFAIERYIQKMIQEYIELYTLEDSRVRAECAKLPHVKCENALNVGSSANDMVPCNGSSLGSTVSNCCAIRD